MKVVFVTLCALLTGCSALPNVRKIESNMDRMTYYMSVMSSCMPWMVDSTRRMADNTDEMKRRAEGFFDTVGKQKKGAEVAVQNYAQALFDNDRAVIGNLKGIRKELGELNASIRSNGGPPSRALRGPDVENRLAELQSQVNSLSAKIDRLERTRR